MAEESVRSMRTSTANRTHSEAPPRDNIILLGDFNSLLRRHAGETRLIGKWCMHSSTDEGGKRLEIILKRHCLKALSTYFQPFRRRSQCTYNNKQPYLAPPQTDYVIVVFHRLLDHELLLTRYQPRLRSSKQAMRKDDSVLMSGNWRDREKITRSFNERVRDTVEKNTQSKDTDDKVRRLRFSMQPRRKCYLPFRDQWTGNAGHPQNGQCL